mmetsp:Transcript_35491/g.118687  ORF Transcript_35491/g.118687 Transcript_35491/m.118687 type:complete len:205 (-) Transcript_35491:81-695(-)
MVASLGYLLRQLAGPGGTVLEVGAGNGRLAHFLNRDGEPLAGRVIATDALAGRGFIGSFGDASVIAPPQQLSHDEAVATHAPAVVVSSWMPEEDWTAVWRAQPSVRAYVMLGECDGGQSGLPWETWGVRPSECFGAADADLPPPPWLVGPEPAADAVPPFQADGWARLGATEPAVAAVTRWMVGQGDEDVPRGNSTCATVFVRG